MPMYRVTFDEGRLGGGHAVEPVIVEAVDLGGLAEAVYDIALPHVGLFPEVVIEQREDEDTPTGVVFLGFNTVGKFHVQEAA